MILYGIPNCDTVKKARKWLDEQNISYEFHDYKKHGTDRTLLKKACISFGWETVLNKRGTTWKKLDNIAKEAITSAPAAITLMLEKPSIIKRPILDNGKAMLIGFDETEWSEKARG